ncbi:hypothetical protein DFR86_11770 [Acidianus sulfidivorans JP7]|uniref:Uncharacterized protein n=1 Tax=Acidianus sulfidivorans JP7 TaxID=619593 RepID=A0A2U9IQA3_9CREN|nr:hypothetical protein [Acidianus sulfidivorans]AWR98147.1 hypothetical protein DFR86_11770 [Acidianus sulfidivorans JP7]
MKEKALSDFIAFLIILLAIVAIIVPAILFTFSSNVSNQSIQQPQPVKVINVTYEVGENNVGEVYVSSSVPDVSVLNIYSYSNGEWVTVSYQQSQNNVYELASPPPKVIEVEISYNGQINYAYLDENTTAFV